MLQQKVDCVIHCAAAVRFNETLKKATVVNVKGTRDVLELARRMERLKVGWCRDQDPLTVRSLLGVRLCVYRVFVLSQKGD